MAEVVNKLEEYIYLLLDGNLEIVSLWPLYSANLNKCISVHINDDILKLKEIGINESGFLKALHGEDVKIVTCGEIGYDFSS